MVYIMQILQTITVSIRFNNKKLLIRLKVMNDGQQSKRGQRLLEKENKECFQKYNTKQNKKGKRKLKVVIGSYSRLFNLTVEVIFLRSNFNMYPLK
jgi:hypothetical protein